MASSNDETARSTTPTLGPTVRRHLHPARVMCIRGAVNRMGRMLQRTVLRAGACGLVGVMLLMAGCGDDDNGQSAVCDAQSQLDEDVDQLTNLDLADTSVNDLEAILSDIGDDVQNLKDAASDRLSPEIDAVSSALDDLGSTIDNLGSSGSPSDAASAIQQSLGDLGTAAGDLKTAVADDENC